MQDVDFAKSKQICPNLITLAQISLKFHLNFAQILPNNQFCEKKIV